MPSVSNVTAVQREGTRLVDVAYDLSHSEGLTSAVSLEARLDGESWTAISSVSGAVGAGVGVGQSKSVVWDAGSEWPAELFPAVQIRVKADDGQSGGPAPEGFALILAGTFTMGSPEDELGNQPWSDESQHEVTLTQDFYIATTEVNWSLWQAVHQHAANRGYSDLQTGRNGFHGDASGQHPVTELSWWSAIKWCNLRSELEGLTPVYYTSASFGAGNVLRTGAPTPYMNLNANGYRLPTEAEWEYACRAGTTTAFYTGDITYKGYATLDPNLDAAGWYRGNSDMKTRPVGQKLANAWGLYDMHGNVWEWCWDWYDRYGGVVTDSTGPTSGSNRVLRGGGWNGGATFCRSAKRLGLTPSYTKETMGFRVARSSVP